MGTVSTAVTASDEVITLSDEPTVFYYPTSSTVAATAPKLDFVVAIRFTETGKDDGFEVVGASWMQFFQLDPNQWNDTSQRRANPTNFVPLPPDASGYCRIKPIPTPKNAGTLFALGKLKFVEMGDSDSPVILGAENVLLAYGEGDMLERVMQYQKAQLKYTEATTLLQICRDLDNVQQDKMNTIVPMVADHWSRMDFI
tara:strand:- start:32 stop:628 length:597 start_codon:yes stop_codon:yes gene_type:complete